MASPTRWTWVWVNSGSWWWTGRPGVLWIERLNWLTDQTWLFYIVSDHLYRSDFSVCCFCWFSLKVLYFWVHVWWREGQNMPKYIFMCLCSLELYLSGFFETWVDTVFFHKRFALLFPVDYTNILGALLLKFSSFNFSITGDINSNKKSHEGQVAGTDSQLRLSPTFLQHKDQIRCVTVSCIAPPFFSHPSNWR